MEKKDGEDELGKELKENNEKIVHCLLEMRTQRDELMFLIQKQKEERKKLEVEMERLTYKLCLINKSMAQRMKAKQNYDSTIDEIEEKYNRLRENSGDLRTMVAKDCEQLDSIINKKTSTEDTVVGPNDDPHAEMSEPILERVSHTSSAKTSQEECVCLPNKDGKCIREKMASKMIQAPSAETEMPTKLEKEPKEDKQKDANSSKYNDEKSAQTSVTGEPDTTSEDDDDGKRAFEKQKTILSRAANKYKDASLRRSL